MRRPGLKKRLGRALTPALRQLFRQLQPLGIHITRNHFYEPVPDTRFLDERLWQEPSKLVGIDLREDCQLALLREVFPRYLPECDYPWGEPSAADSFYFGNGMFDTFDAEVFHCLIRHQRPQTIIEIGSGFSTLLAARAALLNQERSATSTRLIAIEPHPDPVLRAGLPGLAQLIPKPVQQVPLQLFADLQDNDILFIDSSHVVKIGSDVIYEILEILPRLAQGVLIHFHDIFLPREYPKNRVLQKHQFWTEQYLLQAFLACNDSFEVIWAGSHMGERHKELLEQTFPNWKDSYTRLGLSGLSAHGRNQEPGSFWIRRRS